MKKLFIHHPLFRLLSPIFSGIIVYLLILLISNDVEQLQDYFLGQELYICIGLSYIIQEFSRAFLMLFQKFKNAFSTNIVILQIVVSMILCIGLTTGSIILYFKYVEGFAPNKEELIPFNIIFCCITLIYILLHISHKYLHKISLQKLEREQRLKQIIEDDFNQFKQGINPNLLFESLEALITLIKKDKDITDDFIDEIALVYRYILSKRKQQLVSINEELIILESLIKIFNYLPYRNIQIQNDLSSTFLVVPGSLLTVIEQIIRYSINTTDGFIKISVNEDSNSLNITYSFNDKIVEKFGIHLLQETQEAYAIYSDNSITVIEEDGIRKISIPKLTMKA